MSQFSHWVQAIRPRTLPLSVSGIIAGSAIAYRYDAFRLDIFLLAVLTTLGLQILSNLANDYGDATKGTDGDQRIGPERMVQSGKLSASSMKTGIGLTAAISFFSGLALLYFSFPNQIGLTFLLFLLLGLTAIWAAIKYTVGRTAYGYRGLGDVFVLLFFGFVSVVGSTYLFTQQMLTIAFLQSIVIGSFATGVLHLNNMRDQEPDKESGKITLAVKLGAKGSKLYFIFLMLLGTGTALFSTLIYGLHITEYLYLPILIPIAMLIMKVIGVEDHVEYNKYLKPLALSTFAYSLLFFAGVAI